MTFLKIFLLQDILNLFFCVHIKNYYIFKLDFGQTTSFFLLYFGNTQQVPQATKL
jgi:hypothetical protein